MMTVWKAAMVGFEAPMRRGCPCDTAGLWGHVQVLAEDLPSRPVFLPLSNGFVQFDASDNRTPAKERRLLIREPDLIARLCRRAVGRALNAAACLSSLRLSTMIPAPFH